MRCRQCGLEVDNDKAFCPVCGAPMKVTADYDYIQAEIANKVDRYVNEENDHTIEEPDNVRTDAPAPAQGSGRDEFAKTKKVFGSDSIFDDDPEMRDVSATYDFSDFSKDPQEPFEEEEDGEDITPAPAPRAPREPRPRTRARRTRYAQYQHKEHSQTAARVITVLIIFVIIAAAVAGVMAILGVFSNNSDGLLGDGQQAETSTLSTNLTAGSTYTAPVTVTINNALEGNVFYTLDGSEPTSESRIYTGPFEIASNDVLATFPNVTLRICSFSDDSSKSGELTVAFTLQEDPAKQTTTAAPEPETFVVSDPVIMPDSGTYHENTDIMVSSPEGASIYYTYDGSMPDETSLKYLGPVKMIPGSSTFAAICVMNGEKSEIVTRSYELDYYYDISPSYAMNLVIDQMYWSDYIVDYDCNTYEGYAAVSHQGVYEIGGYNYYVIEADFYNQEGVMTQTRYFGVGVNYGGVYWMEKDGDSFFIY